jgi:hypothetical protein
MRVGVDCRCVSVDSSETLEVRQAPARSREAEKDVLGTEACRTLGSGNPAIHSVLRTGGFASPPCGGFALCRNPCHGFWPRSQAFARADCGNVRQSASRGPLPDIGPRPARCYSISLLTGPEKVLSTPALLYALTAKYQRAGLRSSMTTLLRAGFGSRTD